MQHRKVTVRVPATTANLGPGYDCMGMALGLSSSLTIERSPSFAISITGEGAASLSKGRDNLVHASALALYKAIKKSAPTLRLQCSNAIPLNRGLGSSSAAIVSGLVAANALEGNPLGDDALLQLATAIEGHPDNVAPALLGGLQIVVKDGARIISTASPVKGGLKAVLFIPEMELSTKKARAILPSDVSRANAVYNAGRTALLASAFAQGKWAALRIATQDRLHQPQRQRLMPHMAPLIEAALAAGAHGAFLSGAGPAILALASGEVAPVEAAMAKAARRVKLGGSIRTTAVAAPGAHVTKKE
jgi:homoserine kinase